MAGYGYTSVTLFEMVFFFPCFYIQLDAIKHGVNAELAFYSVRCCSSSEMIQSGVKVHSLM